MVEICWLIIDRKGKKRIVKEDKVETKDGIINLKDFKGGKIRSHLNRIFYAVPPKKIDYMRSIKRVSNAPSVTHIGLILAYTGIGSGNNVIDAGTGSGLLCSYLANVIKPGTVYSYEINENFAKIAKKNIEDLGHENVVVKVKDVREGFEESGVDLVTLDLSNPQDAIPHAHTSLTLGGFLAVYSTNIESVMKTRKSIDSTGFADVVTLESTTREMEVGKKGTRSKSVLYGHVGYITFARKVE